MKRFRTLARLTFCSAALACAADPAEFSSGRTSVQYDSRLHQHLRCSGDRGRNVVAFWYPLGVSTNSQLAKNHPELLVQDENGNYPVDDRKVRQLCPAFEPARRHIAGVLEQFIREWEFDGVYVDMAAGTMKPARACRSPFFSAAIPQVTQGTNGTEALPR